MNLMKLAIFNVKFSPNLGDGLLTECLEGELRATGKVEAVSIDLAGREEYGQGLRNRRVALTILENSPQVLRHAIVRCALGYSLRRKLRPRWRQLLRGVDGVVVGGGNLLSDQDLNFPFKLAAAAREAESAGLPAAVFGVGVSDNWSPAGKALFADALRRLRPVHAAVRDERSRQAWMQQLGHAGIAAPLLCRDPGVLAARHFAPSPREGGAVRVGLGITDPLALRYHGASSGMAEAMLNGWLVELTKRLAARAWEVHLFTNGSPEDRAYLARMAPQLVAQAPTLVKITPAFDRPAALVRFISAMDLVMAHRLHACVAAFAFAIPHIGFVWDPKLNAFFAATGRARFVADPGRETPDEVADSAAAAMAQGIDKVDHARVIDLARTDVDRLLDALAGAVRRNGGTLANSQIPS